MLRVCVISSAYLIYNYLHLKIRAAIVNKEERLENTLFSHLFLHLYPFSHIFIWIGFHYNNFQTSFFLNLVIAVLMWELNEKMGVRVLHKLWKYKNVRKSIPHWWYPCILLPPHPFNSKKPRLLQQPCGISFHT